MMKLSLIRIIDAYNKEHYINQNAIVEIDPTQPNMEGVVAIELNNGRRIFVHKSVAEKIIEECGEVVLDMITEIVHTPKLKKDKKNG